MKIRMPRSRPDRRYRQCVVASLLLLGGACNSATRLGGEMRNHPPELVGTWVDIAKSTPNDSALWILGASGEDASQHLQRDTSANNTMSSFVVTAPKHYGYWFAQGAIADDASRAICFTNRPGRSAPTCLSFTLDSVREGGETHRRLLVHGYRGEHHTSDRELVAREP
jgi:hypothetical protein